MADLSVTYSKTPKGLRARSSFIGGLSGKLMKVLSLIDGVSKAQTILTKHDDISADKLMDALTKLENAGYIKPAVVNVFSDDDDWDFGSGPEKFVVEEFSSTTQARQVKQEEADKQVRLEAEQQNKAQELAKQAEKIQQAKQAQEKQAEEKQTELKLAQLKLTDALENTKTVDKAQQQEALIKAIEKAKAQTKVQEQMQAEAAAAQRNLKLEALKKIKAAQVAEAAKLANAKLLLEDRAKLELDLKQQARLAADLQAKVLAQKLADAKAKQVSLAAAENMRLEKARLAQDTVTRRAEKAAVAAQKIAFAETEQLRITAEFEEQASIQADATRAQQAIAAKAKIKAKAAAAALAKAESEKPTQ